MFSMSCEPQEEAQLSVLEMKAIRSASTIQPPVASYAAALFGDELHNNTQIVATGLCR